MASAVKLTFMEMRRSEWKAENNPEPVKEHPEKWLHRDGLFRTSKDHQNDPNKSQNRAVPRPLPGNGNEAKGTRLAPAAAWRSGHHGEGLQPFYLS